MIAVVEAKAYYKKPGDGFQQAKDYAQMLGLKFAYSTNGQGIMEHDYLTGRDSNLDASRHLMNYGVVYVHGAYY